MAVTRSTSLRSLPPVAGERPDGGASRLRRLLVALGVVATLAASTAAFRSLAPHPDAPLLALGDAVCQLGEQQDPAAPIVLAGQRIAVGRELRAVIDNRRLALLDDCAVQVEAGDLPEPFGDGAATHRLRLTDGDGGMLVVRVRHAPGSPTRLLGQCALAECIGRVD